MMNLGYALAESGEYQQGEAILRRAVEGRERTLGPNKDAILWCRYTLVMTLVAQGKVLENTQSFWKSWRKASRS
jgi:hypothetical protein